jgi:O-antigen ligase
MQANRWVRIAERGCLTLLIAWLLWLPLPFGSVIERARLPLLAVPLGLCAITAILRFIATRDRTVTAQQPRAWSVWSIGAALFLAWGVLQLVPLPPSMLRMVSPEASSIWSDASRVAGLAGVPARSAWPLTVDPFATKFEVVRLCAIFAAFTCGALLVRTHLRRRILAVALCSAAVFQALYGIREAALGRYEIWGWANKLVHHRVTGTFVNPNHFAHYIAIALPMAVFLGAALWHGSTGRKVPAAQRIVEVLERHMLFVGFTVLATLACLAGMLLAQSRGAILAMVCAFAGVAAMFPGRRLARGIFAAAAGLLLLASLALFLGPERTLGRFAPTEVGENAGGRRGAIRAAAGVWQRFPIFGSGLGTFERVVSMEQDRDLTHIYHHAHNDYLEIAATTGLVGLLIAIVTLAGGSVALARLSFGAGAQEVTWVRRAYQVAAMASIAVALVHALFDFNFFIPANVSTLAVIAGAAVASLDHDRRTRR